MTTAREEFETARDEARALHPELTEAALAVYTVLRPLFPEPVAYAQAVRQHGTR